MKSYKIQIKLLSDTLLSSGQGFGSSIDSDIMFDEVGLPFIPARRIKGCLKDSLKEILEALLISKNEQLLKQFNWSQETVKADSILHSLFGKSGQSKSSPMNISNLYLVEYDQNKNWLNYLTSSNKLIHKESILSCFTRNRQQIKMEKETGTTKEGSLRTVRVLNTKFNNENMVFTGDIELNTEADAVLISIACQNLKRIGSKRNRGFGEVECILFDEKTNVNEKTLKMLEQLC
ncbi:MAG: hypothetical protein KA146_02290 [Leptospiraceae bacterium]|nr:hypothetical protein [Leptospiraceae bacterium]